MTPAEARVQLIEILDLDPDMDWDDVVYYAAKTRGTVKMLLASHDRRASVLAEVLDLPPSTGWWDSIHKIRTMMKERP